MDLLGALRTAPDLAAAEDLIEDLLRQAADAKPALYDLQREGAIPMRAIGG